jgi:3-hydroxyacyl-CoA dehydrogenase/enoyl-CoA hydratase/3-hydroxybutyryl-CoA epimerase
MTSWHMEQEGSLCLLTLDQDGTRQNVLSSDTLEELEQALGDIAGMNPGGLVIRSGKARGYIAGADVGEFSRVETIRQAEEFVALAHRVFNRIEAFGFPSVALINGHCLGGGLELALACDYRVVLDNPEVRLGLPEVMLGIHPGFGGTVRAMETCGVAVAMDLILSGRTVAPKAARTKGLVDLVVPERQLMPAARHLLHTRPPRRRVVGWKRWLGAWFARPAMAAYLSRRVASRAPREHYPAPHAVIDLWRRYGGDRVAMLRAEQESVSRLVLSPTSRNLVRVFFLREHLKGLGRSALEADDPPFRHVHLVGAGIMGGDIAAWCALRGYSVTLQDRSDEALARAVQRAHELFRRRLRDTRLAERAMDRFQPDPGGTGARSADVVIEAIFEDLEAKQSVFRELEKTARPDALLATNTSSIPLEDIGSALDSPGRLIGLHFFNPVAKMQLVEIVSGERTDDIARRRALAFAGAIGRLPLPVKSSPGFLVNRVLTPYLLEAVELLREGIPATVIDRAATGFGMPMGPIELADTVGLDICLHVATNLADGTDQVPEILRRKVSAGQLGKKSGEGFYHWKKNKPVKDKGDSADSAPGDLVDRLVLRFLNETVACLAEGIVENDRLADGGLVFGTGFAPFRGGPLHHVADRGRDTLRRKLVALEKSHGPRFSPHPGWTESDLAESEQPSGR